MLKGSHVMSKEKESYKSEKCWTCRFYDESTMPSGTCMGSCLYPLPIWLRSLSKLSIVKREDGHNCPCHEREE